MGLLQPESGLLFWTSLAFGIVLWLLCKYGFPIILQAIDERKEYIDNSLKEASDAKIRAMELRQESDKIISLAEAERWKILKKTKEEQEKLAAEIHRKAEADAIQIIEQARKKAEDERNVILQQADSRIIALSIAIAEKLLRDRLSQDSAQAALAGRILDDINKEKDEKLCTQG